jgi:hypothetical protein
MGREIDPGLYDRYKHRIMELGLAVQTYQGDRQIRDHSCLSDGEIADRLGLTRKQVTEIRCIAEVDLIPLQAWQKSDQWKKDKLASAFSRPDPEEGAEE